MAPSPRHHPTFTQLSLVSQSRQFAPTGPNRGDRCPITSEYTLAQLMRPYISSCSPLVLLSAHMPQSSPAAYHMQGTGLMLCLHLCLACTPMTKNFVATPLLLAVPPQFSSECGGTANTFEDHQVGCGGNGDRIFCHNRACDISTMLPNLPLWLLSRMKISKQKHPSSKSMDYLNILYAAESSVCKRNCTILCTCCP